MAVPYQVPMAKHDIDTLNRRRSKDRKSHGSARDFASNNEAARRLYAGLGFVEYGIEKNALKDGGRYYDEVLMAKPLVADANQGRT
jgi:hypothetical protein